MLLHRRGNANTGISDLKADHDMALCFRCTMRSDHYFALIREFHRVPTRLVRICRRRPGSLATQVGTSGSMRPTSSSPLTGLLSQSSSILHGRAKMEINNFQIQFACLNLREIQDVIDQRQ